MPPRGFELFSILINVLTLANWQISLPQNRKTFLAKAISWTIQSLFQYALLNNARMASLILGSYSSGSNCGVDDFQKDSFEISFQADNFWARDISVRIASSLGARRLALCRSCI